jgi:hypothetical protein
MKRAKIQATVLICLMAIATGLYLTDKASTQGIAGWFGDNLFINPDRYIHVTSDSPYVVPPGRVLLLGSMTKGGQTSAASLLVDGQEVWALGYASSGVIFPGVVAREGQLVEVLASNAAYANGKVYIPAGY